MIDLFSYAREAIERRTNQLKKARLKRLALVICLGLFFLLSLFYLLQKLKIVNAVS